MLAFEIAIANSYELQHKINRINYWWVFYWSLWLLNESVELGRRIRSC